MTISISKTNLSLLFIIYFVIYAKAIQQNKTVHHARRSSEDDSFFKNQKQKQDFYRSYQPVSIQYHKNSYPKTEDRTDYDITSYDTEYGGVVSNFTSSIYDDNPPLYPNPEEFSKKQAIKIENKGENEVELPDDSLADADLKEHNIIDSLTYLYGINKCHGPRDEWIILIYINCGVTLIMLTASMWWLLMTKRTATFRLNSKLYPITVNLCSCFIVCTMIYMRAIMGALTPSDCEKLAVLTHYTYLTCSTWIVAMAAVLTEYCANSSVMPLKYNYLFAYGVPAFIVMFNYALSMEQYEIKHYCWMSLEKGMVMGFMVPAMLLIIINTAIILLGLQRVNKKQSESLQTRLQELLDRHEANFRKNEHMDENNRNEGGDSMEGITVAGSSRKNTDSSETLDRYNKSDDNCYVNVGTSNEGINEEGNEPNNQDKDNQERDHNNTIPEPLWMKMNWSCEINELKNYLNLCLVLEPFFAINWVMGVAAIENAGHWTTPAIYLILSFIMNTFFVVVICMNFPILYNKTPISTCCEDAVGEPMIAPMRTTDSIPLLDPSIQQPNGTPAPADSISTISI